MRWEIVYHPDVNEDLESVCPSAVRRNLRAINENLLKAPQQFGAPLSENLTNFRKLRK